MPPKPKSLADAWATFSAEMFNGDTDEMKQWASDLFYTGAKALLYLIDEATHSRDTNEYRKKMGRLRNEMTVYLSGLDQRAAGDSDE